MADKNLLEFLENHLTERRKELFVKVVSERTRYFTIALENIYQPHNASAVMRSCECFGIQDLHIIEKEHSFKASSGVVMGADKWIDLHYYKDSIGCINFLKNMGYRIIATTPHPDNITGTDKNDQILEAFDISRKTAFFFGEESIGLSKQVIDHADGFLKIPMVGFTESFNISVTVAVGGVTIAQIFSNVNMYASKIVKVKGKVVKVNNGIMKTNWVHIQDGTSAGSDFDLTVTTNDNVNVGDVVTFEGSLVLNKDFGYGYSYKVLLENAKANKSL